MALLEEVVEGTVGVPLHRSAFGGKAMIRRALMILAAFVLLTACFAVADAHAQNAYGVRWGGPVKTHNWERFYHYPYTYYPHNFYGHEYYRSAEDLYYRYPQEMRIPVYNRKWFNYYPEERRYHWGHHFILDVF